MKTYNKRYNKKKMYLGFFLYIVNTKLNGVHFYDIYLTFLKAPY